MTQPNGNPRGRPPKRSPEIEAEITTFLQHGLDYATAAARVGIARSTLFKWKAEDSVFSDACNKAIATGKGGMIAHLVKRAMEGSDRCLIEWAQKRTEEFRLRKADDARLVKVEGLVPMKTLDDCSANANVLMLGLAEGDIPIAQVEMLNRTITEARSAIILSGGGGSLEGLAEHMEVIRKAMAPREIAESRSTNGTNGSDH